MGWVAAEVVRHGGIAICSTISPFHESREESREYVEETSGGFVLVHISTSVDECAARDVKGLYQKAKQGLVTLTGVSHPYEFPDKAELTIDAGVVPVENSVDFIIGACTAMHVSGTSESTADMVSGTSDACLCSCSCPPHTPVAQLRLNANPSLFACLCRLHTEYLIHKGYIKEDAVPAKYITVKPELTLKANNVLTEDVVDPASLLCTDKAAAHVAAVVSLLDTAPIAAAITRGGAVVQVPKKEDILAAETAAGVTDTPWVSTPLSTPMLESQLVEAGWGCVCFNE